ncbi:glycosyltransferase [Neobacillus niacini]|uniref:glycosyltransferase n=1 Tax=Neobacillus niacini TaxID=86668 RepID=UPI002864B2B0|nr:glycosyltransferase [Neobacillus niacini]MDR7001036.1 glycosyltransferase involved in cell wall biosynthesis [Neobacillus niacini]
MSSVHTPLLTAHLFVSTTNAWDGLEEMMIRLAENGITLKFYGPHDALMDINPRYPRVYLSLGTEWEEFRTLNALPFHERKRWLHFHSPAEIQPSNLFNCWLSSTDPLPENRTIPLTRFSSDTPLVSVFTASYKSKEKIQRPYRSLLNQTYPHWEWVIIDDSGDEDETYHKDLLPLDDLRVRRYRQDSRNGYIGAVKRYAAGLCAGEILVELDHDDELTSDCLEKIVDAFQRHPECGFAYGENAEVYIGSHHAHWYGWDCGFGYSMYYRVWVHEMNRWQNVLKQTAINGTTIRHLVGLPNHPRAWARDCYHLIGGHREELLVSDDYDLLVRTFLSTKFLAIPNLLYIQYRNENGDNSTIQRNQQIQILCRELSNYYHQRIRTRVKELDLPEDVEYSRVWERTTDDPARKVAHNIHEDLSKVSLLFPIPHSCSTIEHTELFKALQKGVETNFKEIEVVVVGCVPAEIEIFASMAPMGVIRWWPMEPDDSLDTCIQYAKLCASCSKKVVMLP